MTRSTKAALIGLLAVPALVAAHGGSGRRLEFLKEGVGLSDEAAERVAAVMDKGRKEGKPLHRKFHASMAKLRWQVDSEEGSQDVAATLEQVRKARAALREQIERVGKEIDALLTPEQRARMLLARGPGPMGPRGPFAGPPPFDPEGLGGPPPPGPWDED